MTKNQEFKYKVLPETFIFDSSADFYNTYFIQLINLNLKLNLAH